MRNKGYSLKAGHCIASVTWRDIVFLWSRSDVRTQRCSYNPGSWWSKLIIALVRHNSQRPRRRVATRRSKALACCSPRNNSRAAWPVGILCHDLRCRLGPIGHHIPEAPFALGIPFPAHRHPQWVRGARAASAPAHAGKAHPFVV